MSRLCLATVGMLALVCAARGAEDVVGAKAAEWDAANWTNSEPLTLKSLAGKVVLVRWWTDGCKYCAATAPALNEFHAEYHGKGLEVIGFYHHKSSAPLDEKAAAQTAEKFGFKFPVAIDRDWKTLRQWWYKDGRAWTSVSFLIDRQGVIRHVHDGGQYVKGDADYAALKAKIEELLAEHPESARGEDAKERLRGREAGK